MYPHLTCLMAAVPQVLPYEGDLRGLARNTISQVICMTSSLIHIQPPYHPLPAGFSLVSNLIQAWKISIMVPFVSCPLPNFLFGRIFFLQPVTCFLTDTHAILFFFSGINDCVAGHSPFPINRVFTLAIQWSVRGLLSKQSLKLSLKTKWKWLLKAEVNSLAYLYTWR